MNGHINVEYHATTLHKVCMVISLVTIICYLLSMGTEKIDNHRKKTEQSKQKLLDGQSERKKMTKEDIQCVLA